MEFVNIIHMTFAYRFFPTEHEVGSFRHGFQNSPHKVYLSMLYLD